MADTTQNQQQAKQFTKRDVVRKSDDMSAWYTDVILRSGMADYSPVRGCIVYRPLSYQVWEGVQAFLNKEFGKMNVENSYFPLFIPESFLKKEASHVEGFAPELAVVTIGGGEELGEKLVVRPTSETIMYSMYAKWIQSHRDLPLKLNQWNSVVRWEKRTTFFLRGMEFLWQEAHTAHATHEEAWAQVLGGLDAYALAYEELLAIPVIKGIKSESEKFAGADKTTTVELMMPDGKALQGATSHDLGQNFSKAFEISFQDKTGQKAYVWQTSFGYSTRALGAMVMMHGDDQGLVLPPKVAPTQVVVIGIGEDEAVKTAASEAFDALVKKGVRAKLDSREGASLGYKRNDWELKGVPIRVELGKKELESGQVTLTLRYSNEKLMISLRELADKIPGLLNQIHDAMFAKAVVMRDEMTSVVDTYDDFKKIMETKRGFLKAFWCEDAVCEKAIKDETKASTRCLPLDATAEQGSCIKCGKTAKHRWYFAQAY